MIYWITAFTASYMLRIGNVFIANIIFLVWIACRTFFYKIRYRFNKTELNLFLAYIIWVFFTTILFAVEYRYFEIRNLVQATYNLMYIVLIVRSTLDKNKLRSCMYYSSYIIAWIIIVLWVFLTRMKSVSYLIIYNRQWAENYIGGWTTNIILPLVFGLYLEFSRVINEHRWGEIFRIFVFLFSILLTSARSGYVGAFLVIFYFFFVKKSKIGYVSNIIKRLLLFICLLTIIFLLILYIEQHSMSDRMFGTADRLEIYKIILSYFVKRPITGYGGNSLDVIYNIVQCSVPRTADWPHAHNTIFELIFRHGIIGLILFTGIVISSSKKICCPDDKFAYWMFWFLSLFQIYYRNFVFILILYILIPSELKSKIDFNRL